ncbi:MAG: HAD-IC family P-type ATPase, partial [Blautia sp.]|nr:HAD-IC family P-type ATPase [Blautia sp.]
MTGLNTEQINERIAAGQINSNENPNTRSYKQIILENTLTFFNFLNLVLLGLVLMVGSIKNAMFMGTIIINTIIGIVQEIRAKKTLDDLAIMTQSKAVVLREGKRWTLPTNELVLDDVVYLKAGDQIPADAKILEGELEVNESLLTGEADNLHKACGDELFSGSFVTSGEACVQVIHVGKDNYASKITNEAKEFKRHNSELRNSINAILKVISIIIVPIGALLFYKQFYVAEAGLRDSVVATVAGVLGMIPEGLVLLTSIALTVGTIVLAQKKTLVQELYCIETLAHVDTLCLDKTGTLTEGSMQVEDVIPWGERASLSEIDRIMGELMSTLTDKNATASALRKHFFRGSRECTVSSGSTKAEADRAEAVLDGSNEAPQIPPFSVDHVIPFSSERKYSGVVYGLEGTYLLGAVQFLFPGGCPELEEKVQEYSGQGLRVLVAAHSEEAASGNGLPEGLQPLALILLSDVIRAEAPETLAFFDSQDVDLKIISGDDPVTVSAIAKKAGLKDADRYVDATTLATSEELERAVEEYSVFGRVTPQQKKEMVLALKKQKHTVAMTGDGVNDVLALKEADCSIAMAQGSDAAKNIANIVLLDSDFASMPHIVNQGRRVVNNIRMAASMFLIKTMFSAMLAILTIFFGETYPFEPIQMSLISACAVGIPTFLLTQESNYEKIDHTFLRHVFM